MDTIPTTIYKLRSGKRVPSVTTILGAVIAKNSLMKWANRVGLEGKTLDQYLDPLASVGTAIHELCCATLEERAPALDPMLSVQDVLKAEIAHAKFLTWLEDHELHPIALEEHMVHEDLRYGGTPDVVGLLDDKLAIVDFKTGKGIYDDYVLQVGGYALLVRHNGYPVETATILRLGRDDHEGFEELFIDPEALALGSLIFEQARNIYGWQQELGKALKAQGTSGPGRRFFKGAS